MNTEEVIEQFTKGPWRALQTSSQMADPGTTILGIHHDGQPPYYIFYDAKHHGNSAADASLIAAAPELYEVAKILLEHLIETDFDVCGNPEWMIEKANAVLKKATTI